MAKILAITDMDSVGSGYKTICVPLLTGLANLGHEIRVAGLMYQGEEHGHPFSVIPAQSVEDGYGIVHNLTLVWKPDIILVALDIPLQIAMLNKLAPFLKRMPDEENQTPRKYIAITPLENGPLTVTWAMQLTKMDSIFFISELGKQEAIKAGVAKAEHLMIGEDTEFWHPASLEERTKLREGLGISPETFVILTIADNQERKNLWAGMKSVSLLKKSNLNRPIKYIMVTRKQTPFGWNLDDLSFSLDISQEMMFFERGIPRQDLWGLYAVADAYLQPSKAEGLGLPVLDAMACKVPVVATDTGAMHELLEDSRGFLVQPAYEFTDVWGNSLRSMIDPSIAEACLWGIAKAERSEYIDKALAYVESRTWDVAVNQVDSKIKELFNG